VEVKARKIGMVKTKERENKKRIGTEERGKEKAEKSEEKAKKLVPERFYKRIKIFRKKASERMLTRKIDDHTIELKVRFIPRKGKIYPLSREEKEEVREFI